MSTDKTVSQVRERIAEGLQDRLVDASEDLLAEVQRLLTEYDRAQLFETMQILLQIDLLIDMLQQMKKGS